MIAKTLVLTIFLLLGFLSGAKAQDMVIYDDARQNGWENWSWATTNFAATTPVHGGSNSISVIDTTTSYQALFLHHAAFNPSSYQSLNFWIYPTISGTNRVGVAGRLGANTAGTFYLSFTPGQVNQWQQVSIPLASLGVANNAAFEGIVFQNFSGGPMTFYVDDIKLVEIPPPNSVSVTVQPSSVVRTIDNRLFGMNLAI